MCLWREREKEKKRKSKIPDLMKQKRTNFELNLVEQSLCMPSLDRT